MNELDPQTKALNEAFMQTEPHSLPALDLKDIATDVLYYGEGGTSLGRLAVIREDDEDRLCASGYVLNNGIVMPQKESLVRNWGGRFIPLKPLFYVAPELTGDYLAKYTFRQDLAFVRRQIIAMDDYLEELKQAPAYLEYLEYLNNVIAILERADRILI